MKNPQANDEELSICIGCGLCCDGTLHGHAKVHEGDESAVRAVGLAVVEEGGKRIFRQPCPHFACGQCTVYAMRPKVCRVYRCALLKSHEAGGISRSEALQRIATAKELVASVTATAPEAVTPASRSALAKRLKAELPTLSAADRQRPARTLLGIAALDHFLGQWFYKKKPSNQEDDQEQSSVAAAE